MKYRPSRSFVLCLVPLLASGAAGAWAWNKANSAPMHIRTTAGFFELLRYKQELQFDTPTPEEIAKTREATGIVMEKLLAEFPELRITGHPVADEDNGFLLLHELSKEGKPEGLPITPEFQKFLNAADARWEPEIARLYLAEHSHLVTKIEHIASLPTRSSSRMPDDYVGFISARTGKNASDILLLKARLAAEVRDEEHAFRQIAAARNIASHYGEVEAPTFLVGTVTILIEAKIRDTVFKHILPAFGRNTDLGRWRSVLSPRGHSNEDFAKILRGEWDTSTRYLLLPIVLNKDHPGNPPDPEELARALAANVNSQIERVLRVSPNQFFSGKKEQPTAEFSDLSKPSREMMKTMEVGWDAWWKGYMCQASIAARYHAALDLLILEKAGVTLRSDTTAQVTIDPTSSSPFVFDPQTRVLSSSSNAGEMEAEPLRLPW